MTVRTCKRMGGVRLVVRLVLLSIILVFLVLIVRVTKDRNEGWNRRDLLGLPIAVPLGSSPLEREWVQGQSREGFLEVDKVLRDPRTTKDPLTAETYEQQVGGEGRHKVGAERRHRNKDKHLVANPIENFIGAAAFNSGFKPIGNWGVGRSEYKGEGSDFQSVMSYNKNYQPHVTRDLFTPGYHIPNPGLCSSKAESVLVTIMVISSPDHKVQREAIRKTWGKYGKREDTVFGFLVGEPTNQTVRDELFKESEEFGDIIMNKIADLYQNLSLKTLSAFSWVSLYCPSSQFLLKVDDDMFVQVPRLLNLAKELSPSPKQPALIVGHISRAWKPVRNPQSKYYISESQYNATLYPDFATGPSYLVSRSAMDSISEAALDSPYIHLEDVFLTGVVAQGVGVERRHSGEFRNNANRIPAQFMGCTLMATITIHKVRPEEQEEMEEAARKPKCGREKEAFIEVNKIMSGEAKKGWAKEKKRKSVHR